MTGTYWAQEAEMRARGQGGGAEGGSGGGGLVEGGEVRTALTLV